MTIELPHISGSIDSIPFRYNCSEDQKVEMMVGKTKLSGVHNSNITASQQPTQSLQQIEAIGRP